MAEERGLHKYVRVWNDGAEDFAAENNGTMYRIPAGKSIEVSRRIGVELRAMYFGRGKQVSLRLEPLPEKGYDGPKDMQPATAKEQVWCCPTCDKPHSLKADMLACRDSHKARRGRPSRKAVKNDAEPSTDDNS